MARSYVEWSELRTGWVAGAARPFLCGRAISVLVTPPGTERSRTSVANGPAPGRSSRRHPHANKALYSTRLLVTERFQPEPYNGRTPSLRLALATSLAEGIFLSHDNHCSARVGDRQTSPTNEPNAHNQQP